MFLTVSNHHVVPSLERVPPQKVGRPRVPVAQVDQELVTVRLDRLYEYPGADAVGQDARDADAAVEVVDGEELARGQLHVRVGVVHLKVHLLEQPDVPLVLLLRVGLGVGRHVPPLELGVAYHQRPARALLLRPAGLFSSRRLFRFFVEAETNGQHLGTIETETNIYFFYLSCGVHFFGAPVLRLQ